MTRPHSKHRDEFLHQMMRLSFVVLALVGFLWQVNTAAADLPVGQLSHDGPPTPEQVSLYLPVTGALDLVATASVRYRPTTGANWSAAHPLYRIRISGTAGTPPADAFAGVITDLTPGTSYTVEVAIRLGGSSVTTMLTAVTRALPGPAGTPTKVIAAGSTSSQIQAAFDQSEPGEVIQFTNGTYTVDDLLVRRSGTPSMPIYIRGESRTGVVLKSSSGRNILRFLEASDVVVENLTLVGSKQDSGTDASSRGIVFWGDTNSMPQQRVTIRQITIDGVDMGIVASSGTQQLLVYDNTLVGNNLWAQDFLESNRTWNDDGIRVPGQGNAVFNNTLSGFGDSLTVNDGVDNVGIHFYRNEIRWTGDDTFEGDYGTRNITFYDNRVHNAMTLASFDPIYSGPAFVFRNIAINLGRSPYKLNNKNSGIFLYNNTVVRTNGYGSGAGWGWNQSNNGPLTAWGYRNNILIYRGTGNLMAMESSGQNPIDFTHNAWYPDKAVWWSTSGGSFSSISAARSGLPPTQGVFSASTTRHEGCVITEADPFVEEIKLGDDYLTLITQMYVPILADGTAPRAKGESIPGITDGFSGDAPDIGALISGRPVPTWGDRSAPGAQQRIVTALEYFHAGFAHYFVTAEQEEIRKLDAGVFSGWARTGQGFNVYTSAANGLVPVCRFFTTAFPPSSSHFYALRGLGCEGTLQDPHWQLESDVFYMRIPDANGNCPSAMSPVYRLYNNGQGGAPNHRFTTSYQTRLEMLANGYIAEGVGIGVGMCAPI